MDAQKPGWKTSEFWLSLFAVLLGALFASGLLACPVEGCTGMLAVVVKLAGLATTLLGAFGYNVSRTMVKNANSNAVASIALGQAALVPVNPPGPLVQVKP